MTSDHESASEQTRTHKIRSFVRRQGRLTTGQQHALEEFWPVYGIECSNQHLDPGQYFDSDHPLIVEIGFGNGDTLAEMAMAEPHHNFIGIEVHKPGVGHLLHRLATEKIDNVRIICDDAMEILTHCIRNGSLSGIRLYFPDPWPKKRHHKRRIVQPSFIELVADKLKPGGILHMATDWTPYAEHMLEVMSQQDHFQSMNDSRGYSERPEWRPMTKFEKRGLRLGHRIHDLIYSRNN